MLNTLNHSLADIAFIKEKTSPNLITVYQGENLGLRCSYCVAPSKDTTLSWYKEGLMISNDTHHVIHKDELGIPVVEHSKDEGLYQCVVSSNSGKISRFITVIVKKGGFRDREFLLFSVRVTKPKSSTENSDSLCK